MSAKKYMRGVQAAFGCLGNWPPITPVAVGDVGILGPNGFQRHTHGLRYFGPSFGVGPGQLVPPLGGDLSHHTVASAELVASGETGEGEVEFTFAGKGQFAFQATGCTSTTMQHMNLAAIESQCLDGMWKEDWIIVTEVIHAERATILLSQSRKASLRLKGPTGIEDLLVADLKVSASTGEVARFLGVKGVVAMFRALRVKRSFFRTHAWAEQVTRGPGDADFGFEDVVLEDDA